MFILTSDAYDLNVNNPRIYVQYNGIVKLFSLTHHKQGERPQKQSLCK